MKLLAFDIEIFKMTSGDNWRADRPFGVSCAATLTQDQEAAQLWHGADKSQPMTPAECQALFQYLSEMQAHGYQIVTWNGLSFDFDVLAEEADAPDKSGYCKMALDHYDIMFQFLCVKGYPVGLNAVAQGMKLGGKTGGMDGADAPKLWQAGEYDTVLAYVAGDVALTLQIAQAVQKSGRIHWITQKGKRSSADIGQLCSARDALALELPDTSWMKKPLPRQQFYHWIDERYI